MATENQPRLGFLAIMVSAGVFLVGLATAERAEPIVPPIGAGIRFQANELGPGWHRGFFNQYRTVPPCYIVMTFISRTAKDQPLRVDRTIPIARVERLQATANQGTSMQEWDGLDLATVPENSWQDINLAPLQPDKNRCQFEEPLG